MSRGSFQKVLVSCVLGIVLFGGTVGANAAWLSNNGDLGVSWTYGEGASLASGSQSPFTNAFGNNSSGAHIDARTGDHGVLQSFTEIPATATGMLYLNVDFRNNDSNAGYYTLTVDSDSGVTVTSDLKITGSEVYVRSASGYGASLLTPAVGTWYNVQLALNLDTDTYSGTITPYGGSSIAISERSFVQSNTKINNIFSSTYGNTVNCPDHDIDNFVLSDTVIPSPVPEPGMIALLGIAMFGLLAYAWKKRK